MILIWRSLFWFIKYEFFPPSVVFAFISIGSLIMTTNVQYLEGARSEHEVGTIVSTLQMIALKLRQGEGLAQGHIALGVELGGEPRAIPSKLGCSSPC